jgi:two-component system cell cycle response regulator
VDLESTPPVEQARRILIVDDDASRRELFARVLRGEGYEIDTLSDGTDLLSRVRENPPDLVLLDVMLPTVSGFELCGDLRMMDDARLMPIILLTAAFPDEESVVRGLLSGADDYIVTPSRLDELRARVRVQLRNRRDRELLQWARRQGANLRSAAFSDSLTGLANRRAADRALDDALQNQERVLAVSIDIDRFKSINDGFGHATGDRVLAEVGKAIASRTRAADLAARYGGEEFLVVVRGASLEVAARIGQRYCDVVREMRPIEGGPAGVTISVGIAGAEGQGVTNRATLLARADAALYQAKNAGRDRVVVDDCPVGSPNPEAGQRDRGRP